MRHIQHAFPQVFRPANRNAPALIPGRRRDEVLELDPLGIRQKAHDAGTLGFREVHRAIVDGVVVYRVNVVQLGFGVVAMTMLSDSLFSGWGWRLYGIQVGYRATYLVLMGAICGGWSA